jgi:hypothetical protein
MAQIVMLQDHDGKKKGELVHTGCLDGRAMVQMGVAVYWDGKPLEPSPMQIKAVPPVELKTEQPIKMVNDDIDDAILEELTAPKPKKKHKHTPTDVGK